MTDTPNDAADSSRETIVDLCEDLVEDAKFLARAEIFRVRAILFRRMVKGRIAVFYMVTSALLAQAAGLVLLLGLLMYLRIHVGILGATAIVTVGAIIMSGLFAWLAFRKIKRALSKEDDLL